MNASLTLVTSESILLGVLANQSWIEYTGIWKLLCKLYNNRCTLLVSNEWIKLGIKDLSIFPLDVLSVGIPLLISLL